MLGCVCFSGVLLKQRAECRRRPASTENFSSPPSESSAVRRRFRTPWWCCCASCAAGLVITCTPRDRNETCCWLLLAAAAVVAATRGVHPSGTTPVNSHGDYAGRNGRPDGPPSSPPPPPPRADETRQGPHVDHPQPHGLVRLFGWRRWAISLVQRVKTNTPDAPAGMLFFFIFFLNKNVATFSPILIFL